MLSSNSREAALEASISHQPHFSIYCEVRGGCERCPQADHHADNVLVMVNSRGPKLDGTLIERFGYGRDILKNAENRMGYAD